MVTTSEKKDVIFTTETEADKFSADAGIARALNGFKAANNGNLLPDLSKIKLDAVDEQELKQKEAEAVLRKQWVENAAGMLHKIRATIANLEQIAANGILSQSDQAKLAELKKSEQEIIKAGDEELKKHLQFSLFVEEVRTAKPTVENAARFLEKLVSFGRYLLATEEEVKAVSKDAKWPQGTLFFHGKIYVPVFSAKSQDAIGIETVRFLKAVKDAEADKEAADMERLKSMGNKNLDGLGEGALGRYAIYFDNFGTRDKGRLREGVALVEIAKQSAPNKKDTFIAIKVLDGAGSCRWLKEYAGHYINFSWFMKEIKDGVNGELREFAEKLIKMLRAGMMAHKSRRKSG